MRRLANPFILGGLFVVVALGVLVSPFASSSPDGLEKVAQEKGFAQEAEDHELGESPLADYQVDGVEDEKLSTAASGLIGVLATFGIGLVLFGLLRRGRSAEAEADAGTGASASSG